MPPPEEYYRVLNLDPDASLADIKQAYRELAKEWHPDLYPYGPELRRRCETKMRRINEAYEHLRRYAGEQAATATEDEAGDDAGAEDAAERAGYGPEGAGEEAGPADPEAEPSLEPWRERPGHARGPGWAPFRQHVPMDRPDYAGLLQAGAGFVAAIAAMAAIFALDDPTREGYYRILRTAVSLSSVYGAYYALSRAYREIAIGLVLLALALNPLLPVAMSLDEWRVFNFVCPLVLVYIW
ncbi:MAG: J domain-containing protein, partial [Elusimicrobiota bacterium]